MHFAQKPSNYGRLPAKMGEKLFFEKLRLYF